MPAAAGTIGGVFPSTGTVLYQWSRAGPPLRCCIGVLAISCRESLVVASRRTPDDKWPASNEWMHKEPRLLIRLSVDYRLVRRTPWPDGELRSHLPAMVMLAGSECDGNTHLLRAARPALTTHRIASRRNRVFASRSSRSSRSMLLSCPFDWQDKKGSIRWADRECSHPTHMNVVRTLSHCPTSLMLWRVAVMSTYHSASVPILSRLKASLDDYPF